MSWHNPTCFFFVAVMISPGRTPQAGTVAQADNLTPSTACAEEDNVNIPLSAPSAQHAVARFTIEATHPHYDFQVDYTAPNFTSCEITSSKDYWYDNPMSTKVFDDGTTAIIAIRQSSFWQPSGMSVSAPQSNSAAQGLEQAHYIAVHRKSSQGDYPQVMVLYADGNLRLKPQPESGRPDTVFGSSIVIGPAASGNRPYAHVDQVQFVPELVAFDVTYATGDHARLFLSEISSTRTAVHVEAEFQPGLPFATFRSMFVAAGNADVDSVRWIGPSESTSTASVRDFRGGLGSEFQFYRTQLSKHNTSAPDIGIGDFAFVIVPEPNYPVWVLPVVLLGAARVIRHRAPQKRAIVRLLGNV